MRYAGGGLRRGQLTINWNKHRGKIPDGDEGLNDASTPFSPNRLLVFLTS